MTWKINFCHTSPAKLLLFFIENRIRAKTQFRLWNPMDFNNSCLHKNSPPKSSFYFCFTYKPFWPWRSGFCLTSAVVLTFYFWAHNFRAFINRKVRALSTPQTQFAHLKQKMLVAPVWLIILSKHMVRLRCRCSCKMYGTSAVPLLVISETWVKPS